MRTSSRDTDDTALDYVQRVNRVIDHIVDNLVDPLRLDTVAEIACFSPFHFHRVFKQLMGETINEFVGRLHCELRIQLPVVPGRRTP